MTEISKTPIDSEQYLLCNNHIDFRACYGTMKILANNSVVLPADIAEGLNVQKGSEVRYVDKHREGKISKVD